MKNYYYLSFLPLCLLPSFGKSRRRNVVFNVHRAFKSPRHAKNGLAINSRRNLQYQQPQFKKDAIVQFNGGCTAELISKDGLVLTNHHCGYDAIAELSSAEKNYLKNGYWAKTDQKNLNHQVYMYVSLYVWTIVQKESYLLLIQV